MRRNIFTLVLGLAMVLTLAGCSTNTAPDVTPTPTHTVAPTATPHMDTSKPEMSDNAQYEANGDGQVEGTTPPAGTTARNAMDKAGNTVRHAADDAGDAVREMGRDVRNAVR